MKSTLRTKEYEFVWDKDSSRQATVVFVYKNEGGWTFRRCNFNLSCPYNIDDWEFLHDIAEEIKRLDNCKTENE